MIKSLSRGISILEAFSPDSPKLGITEISKKTGLSKSTVYRFVTSLCSLGYIISDSNDNKYTIGPKVLNLGYSVLSSLGLRELSYPYLLDLSQKIQETITLSVIDRFQMFYIETIKKKAVVTVNIPVGFRSELYNNASGQVLLAFQDEKWLLDYLKYLKNLPSTEKYCMNKGKHLFNILANVKNNRYSFIPDEKMPDLFSLAAPIFNKNRLILGSLSIIFLSRSNSSLNIHNNYIPLLLKTSDDLSSSIPLDFL